MRQATLRLRPFVASLLIITLGIALGACDARKSTRCALTNIDAGLRSGDAKTLGWAAACALAQPPESLATHVPALLKQLGDRRVYRVGQSGGGLIGFGEAGPRELAVGQVALRAVETAAPTAANIEPIVMTMVAALNAMKSTARLGLYGELATTATALIQVLAYKYLPAGLGSAVASAMRAALPQVRDAVLSNDAWRLAELDALARGEVRAPYAALQPPAVGKQSTITTRNGQGAAWPHLGAAARRTPALRRPLPWHAEITDGPTAQRQLQPLSRRYAVHSAFASLMLCALTAGTRHQRANAWHRSQIESHSGRNLR